MRICSILVSFLLHEVKSDATETEKTYTQIFKRFIRDQCGTSTGVATGCINEALGGTALNNVLATDADTYHYHMEWENEDDTTQTFEFQQEDDPFEEEEEEESLVFAKWGGANILLEDDSFKSIFRKVRQKVFRWLKEKYPEEFPSSRRRRDVTDEQIDEEVDDGFDKFIQDLNDSPDTDYVFKPKNVYFGKAKPYVPTTVPSQLQTTTNADWSGCREGWTQLKLTTDTCFQIITPGGYPTWQEAREGCEARESHLIIMRDDNAHYQISQSSPNGIWFGASDYQNENDWIDVNGKELKYTKWASGEPNNGPIHRKDEDCGMTNWRGSAIWNDQPCNNHKKSVESYACEYANECGARSHSCDVNAECTDVLFDYTCECNIGFEGDGYACTDIDECSRGSDDCGANAFCTNTIGSFTCTCDPDWYGDGIHCTVLCATVYENYPTFNNGGDSFSTGEFEVSNLATMDTGDQQVGEERYSNNDQNFMETIETRWLTNWKPSESWSNKVSYVKLEPQCKLEAFGGNGFSQRLGAWGGAANLQNGHEMIDGKENNKINSYKCTCSRPMESCESHYAYGKDVPKGCPSPTCDVATYSLTDSWRRKEGNRMKYGFALKVAIPEEYWNNLGWSVIVRFKGVDINSGSFQLWNANFFNFFRKQNEFEILIHQKHFIGNDLADKHSFLLIVDKMTLSNLPEFYFFTDRQKKHQCFDKSMHQRSGTSFDRAIESSTKLNTYEDVTFVTMKRTGEFRIRP